MRLGEEIDDQSSILQMISVLFNPMMEKDMNDRLLEIYFFNLKEKEEASWSKSFCFFCSLRIIPFILNSTKKDNAQYRLRNQ